MPNDRPSRPNLPPDDESRSHRVPDSARPQGGPFGPPKKKRHMGPAPANYQRPPSRPFPRNESPQRPASAFPPPSPAPSKPARPRPSAQPTNWSEVAQWYDDLVGHDGSEFHREVVLPGTMKLLGDVKGKNILDIACGQGVLSRLLQTSGAHATGIDSAEQLISAARDRGPSDITYLVGDATTLHGIQDASFDAAACLLAIQNIHPPQGVFTSAARILKPGGRFIVVMMHPAFRAPKTTHWGWFTNPDGTGGIQFRRVDRYLIPRKEPIITHPGIKTGEGAGQYTWTFHRPIGDYITFMRKAGLLVDALEEWTSHKQSDSGPRAAAENTARKEIPMFLAIRGVKISALDTPTELPESPQSADLPSSETPSP